MSTGVVFDWDGTLHEHPHYRATFGRVNLRLIDEAFDRGLSVAVSTCNDVWRIAEYLEDHGYTVLADTDLHDRIGQSGWHGGRSGRVILVTNLKVSGYLIDDRAFNYHYGQSTRSVWERVEQAEHSRPGHVSRTNSAQRKIAHTT